MKRVQTKILTFKKVSNASLKTIVGNIASGALIAFPTDTVYGFGAEYLCAEALKRIYAIKKRSTDKPLILMIGDKSALAGIVSAIPEKVALIMKKFWPGALTLIFEASIPLQMLTGKKTVGVRMPKHEGLLKLLRACPRPLATTSANLSGKKSSVSEQEVIKQFKGKVDFIFKGGLTEHEQESTILDVSTYPYRILREGVITSKQLIKYL